MIRIMGPIKAWREATRINKEMGELPGYLALSKQMNVCVRWFYGYFFATMIGAVVVLWLTG